jgi:F420-dependent oxidoreductase-like protein
LGKLKFGIFLPFYAFQAKSPAEYFETLKNIVLESERLCYDAFWLDDHLMYNDWSILEPWITLSALSQITNRIRLGTMVTCNAHRNPALLAKTAATLDNLSNGRLELGIGAGTQEQEHISYGFDFPKPTVRIEQLGEAIEVMTRLWTKKKATYQGKYYSLKDAVCEPKPIQTPRLPITVGGCGEKHALKVTAKYADRFDWGFLPSFDEYKHKLVVLKNHCKSVGRDFGEIEKSCWPSGQILVAKDPDELTQKIAKLKPSNISLEEFKKSTLAVTPQECQEHLQVYVDLGVSYFMLYFADLPSLEGLRLFAEAVFSKM